MKVSHVLLPTGKKLLVESALPSHPLKPTLNYCVYVDYTMWFVVNDDICKKVTCYIFLLIITDDSQINRYLSSAVE